MQREEEMAGWMRRALDGDQLAYRQLLEALRWAVRGVVMRQLARFGGGSIDVDDVVQETLLALHLKRHTWRRSDPIGPWISAITRNKLIDVVRRRGRHVHVPFEDIEQTLFSADDPLGEAREDVDTVMESLDERQRSILRLVSIEGHSCKEAGAVLRMNEVAVRVALHRALKALAAIHRRRPS